MIITWLKFIKNEIITIIINENKCGKPEKLLSTKETKIQI